jgi:hypothetical protein
MIILNLHSETKLSGWLRLCFCDVTLSVHPHRASWKVCLTTVGIEPTTFGIPTVQVRQTFQLARCGCTLRVTSQTSYSPEYITLRNKKCHSIIVSWFQRTFPPHIYYKIFTHRNVVDMCANSAKNYTKASTKQLVPRQYHNKEYINTEQGIIWRIVWAVAWVLRGGGRVILFCPTKRAWRKSCPTDISVAN